MHSVFLVSCVFLRAQDIVRPSVRPSARFTHMSSKVASRFINGHNSNFRKFRSHLRAYAWCDMCCILCICRQTSVTSSLIDGRDELAAASWPSNFRLWTIDDGITNAEWFVVCVKSVRLISRNQIVLGSISIHDPLVVLVSTRHSYNIISADSSGHLLLKR